MTSEAGWTDERIAALRGHTPGPWVAVESGGTVSVVDDRGFGVVTAEATPILLGYHEKLGITHWAIRPGEAFIDLDDAEQAANARLIASAPDMLAEIERAHSEIAVLREALEGVIRAQDCYRRQGAHR